jgi:hypothetical protein
VLPWCAHRLRLGRSSAALFRARLAYAFKAFRDFGPPRRRRGRDSCARARPAASIPCGNKLVACCRVQSADDPSLTDRAAAASNFWLVFKSLHSVPAEGFQTGYDADHRSKLTWKPSSVADECNQISGGEDRSRSRFFADGVGVGPIKNISTGYARIVSRLDNRLPDLQNRGGEEKAKCKNNSLPSPQEPSPKSPGRFPPAALH